MTFLKGSLISRFPHAFPFAKQNQVELQTLHACYVSNQCKKYPPNIHPKSGGLHKPPEFQGPVGS